MRTNEKAPTYAETYNSLVKIAQMAQYALHELGKIEGRNNFGSEEEIRYLVIDTSMKIIQNLPVHQLERDDIDNQDSVFCSILNRAADEVK